MMRRSRLPLVLLAGLVVVGLLPGVAAGQVSDAKVGNLVWEDLDGDGRQDSGEPGLAGVTVELLDAGGLVAATRVTNGTGRWAFRVDASADWRVRVTAPGGRSFSPRDAFWNDAKDSDANARGLISIPAGSLIAGQVDRSFDAGVVPLVALTQIGNRVWSDTDGDGRQEFGEPGVAGVTVELLDAGGSVVATRVTNRKGLWGFIVDPALGWIVRVTAPGGMLFSPAGAVPNDGRDSDADAGGLITIGAGTLEGGVADRSFDAGLGDIPDAPVFTSDGGGMTAAVEVLESQTSVTDLEATDADGDTEGGGGLTYALTVADPCAGDALRTCDLRVAAPAGADNGLFTLDADSGLLTFTTVPDFEVPGDSDGDNDYQVQVRVTDSTGLMDMQNITVTVLNADSGAIVIILDLDVVGENSQVFVFEHDVAAGDTVLLDDWDSDDARPNTETIEGVGSGGYEVTGFAAVDWYLSSLTCVDAVGDASTGSTDTATAFINMDDGETVTCTFVWYYNEAPEITSDGGGPSAAVDAAENQTAVTDVEASDDNGDTEGDGLTYSLTTTAAAGADNDLFDLDPGTGVLTFEAAPDFETPGDADGDNDYEVQVTVTDSLGRTDFQDIVVTVTDVAEGTIVIRAQADSSPADLRFVPIASAMSFTQDIDATGGFMLDPVAGPNPDTKTFSDVSAGTYVVAGTLPATLGWYGSILSCVDSSVEGIDSTVVASFAGSTATATINLDPGETVTCTWFYSAFET